MINKGNLGDQRYLILHEVAILHFQGSRKLQNRLSGRKLL